LILKQEKKSRIKKSLTIPIKGDILVSYPQKIPQLLKQPSILMQSTLKVVAIEELVYVLTMMEIPILLMAMNVEILIVMMIILMHTLMQLKYVMV